MEIHLRLVYQQAEINLLDDPLAALDAEVGQAVFHQVIGSSGDKTWSHTLFEQCADPVLQNINFHSNLFTPTELAGVLAGTTRLLVTHNPAVLQFMDSVVVVKDGKIVDQGTYTDLVARGGLAGLLAEGGQEGVDGDDDQKKEVVKKDDGPLAEGEADSARLTEDEEAMTGKVGISNLKCLCFSLKVRWTVYLQYIRAIGLAIFSFNFFMYFVCEGMGASANYVLSRCLILVSLNLFISVQMGRRSIFWGRKYKNKIPLVLCRPWPSSNRILLLEGVDLVPSLRLCFKAHPQRALGQGDAQGHDILRLKPHRKDLEPILVRY